MSIVYEGLHPSTDGALWIEIATKSRQPTLLYRGAHTVARLYQSDWIWLPSDYEDETYAVIDIAEAANGDMWFTYDLMSVLSGEGPKEEKSGGIGVYRNGSIEYIDPQATPGIKGAIFRGVIPRRDGGIWVYAKDSHWPLGGFTLKRPDGPVDWLLSFDGQNWDNTPLNEVIPWSITYRRQSRRRIRVEQLRNDLGRPRTRRQRLSF